MKKILNVNFKIVFVWTVAFMVFCRLFKVLNNFPEIFLYANVLYHIFDNIFDIVNLLLIGVSGSIIFYYVDLFLVAKKGIDKYYDLRSDLTGILLTYMDVLKELDYFEELKKLLEESKYPTFTGMDTNVLVSIINNSPFNGKSYEYEQPIQEQLPQTFSTTLDIELSGFKRAMESFKNAKKFITFKESSEKYANLATIYDDLHSSNYVLKEHIDEIDITDKAYQDTITEKCEWFILFLQETVSLINDMENLIKYIDDNSILKFIKMMD